jgi:hypothetical protein
VFTIPDSVTSIEMGAFAGCTSLMSIIIPENFNVIMPWAFFNCTSLTSVTIPNKVTSIGNQAFYTCTSLTTVNIPGNVTTIGSNAFYSCTSLTSITIPESVISIEMGAFLNCVSLTSLIIPSGITSIANSAFGSCTSLSSITILGNVTSIGDFAFYHCASLTSIVIPGNVTYIGGAAFDYCISLTSITIPGKVAFIGASAFEACTSLTNMTFLGLISPTTGNDWIKSTPVGIRGHVYAESNFPAPGNDFNGLVMGSVTPATIPSIPTGLSTTPGKGQAILAWNTSADNGGSRITGYNIYRSTAENGTYSWIAISSTPDYIDTGLTVNETYWYEVSAVNSIGEGARSSACSVYVTEPTSPATNGSTLIWFALIGTIVMLIVVLLAVVPIILRNFKLKK